MHTLLYLTLAGVLISFYSLVELININRKPDYKPLCDINESISCSKAFLSSYGGKFGLPNPLIGLVFYIAFFLLVYFRFDLAVLYMSIIALAATLRLSFLLYFRIKTLCIVCTLTYIINIIIFILVIGG